MGDASVSDNRRKAARQQEIAPPEVSRWRGVELVVWSVGLVVRCLVALAVQGEFFAELFQFFV